MECECRLLEADLDCSKLPPDPVVEAVCDELTDGSVAVAFRLIEHVAEGT